MRILKIVLGFVLLAAGAAMVVLPGPGWLTIAAGLAMLASEFSWARRALDRLTDIFTTCRDQLERAVFRWAPKLSHRIARAVKRDVTDGR